MLEKYIRRDKQFVLNFVAVLGVGLTMISAIKDTTKACKLINDEMSFKDKVKTSWKCYIPSSIVAASTMLCIMYSDYTTMNQKITLLNALMTVQNNYSNLRTSVNEVCNKETKEEILKNTIREKVPKNIYIEQTGEKIFWEEYTGKFFTSTIDNVLKAEYLFNKQLSIVGYASLNDFYDLLGISKTEAGEILGWSVHDCYSSADTTNPWVDFVHEKMEDDEGMEYHYLSYAVQPIVNYDMF
jgi:hypothetical protein